MTVWWRLVLLAAAVAAIGGVLAWQAGIDPIPWLLYITFVAAGLAAYSADRQVRLTREALDVAREANLTARRALTPALVIEEAINKGATGITATIRNHGGSVALDVTYKAGISESLPTGGRVFNQTGALGALGPGASTTVLLIDSYKMPSIPKDAGRDFFVHAAFEFTTLLGERVEQRPYIRVPSHLLE